jgi:hypothetical protein
MVTVNVSPSDPLVGLSALMLGWRIVKLLAKLTVCVPVTAVTVCVPTVAALSIAMVAVALVALVTVTGPYAPSAAPPTEIPGPKFACVVPWTNVVLLPVRVTVRVSPSDPLVGLIDESRGETTFKVAEFELEKVVPVELLPEIVTA